MSLSVILACAGARAQNPEPGQVTTDEDAAESLPAHIDPAEIRGGVPMGGRDGRGREQLTYERIIRNVEPDLEGDPDRLQAYVSNFIHECVSDKRHFAVDIRAEWQNGTVLLTGHAEFAQIRNALEKYFHYLKFDKIDNRVELLPSAELGERLFGIVMVPSVHIYGGPDPRSEKMTTDFIGDVVHLLKPGPDGYFLCHSSEGYVGYILGEAIWPSTAAEVAEFKSGPLATFRRMYREGDLFFPAGTVLPVEATGASAVELALPTGEIVTVPAELVSVRDGAEVPAAVEEAIHAARELLGSRYLWGGKNAEGVDCSGLVQVAYRSQGIVLARDASQQILAGRLVATRWHMDQMKPGDLVYFLGGTGKVSHTGMYIGNMEYVEATGPVTRITSFDPESPNYNESKRNRFCFAKRVIE